MQIACVTSCLACNADKLVSAAQLSIAHPANPGVVQTMISFNLELC